MHRGGSHLSSHRISFAFQDCPLPEDQQHCDEGNIKPQSAGGVHPTSTVTMIRPMPTLDGGGDAGVGQGGSTDEYMPPHARDEGTNAADHIPDDPDAVAPLPSMIG